VRSSGSCAVWCERAVSAATAAASATIGSRSAVAAAVVLVLLEAAATVTLANVGQHVMICTQCKNAVVSKHSLTNEHRLEHT
jgi:hypothetical protein